MKAVITKIERNKPSKHGGTCDLVCFKGEDGQSYISWIASECRNRLRWTQILERGEGQVLENLMVKDGNLIDADSFPVFVRMSESYPQDVPKKSEVPKEEKLDGLLKKMKWEFGNEKHLGIQNQLARLTKEKKKTRINQKEVERLTSSLIWQIENL